MHCRKISQEQTFKGHAGSLWIEPDYEGMQSWTFAAWSSSCIFIFQPRWCGKCRRKRKRWENSFSGVSVVASPSCPLLATVPVFWGKCTVRHALIKRSQEHRAVLQTMQLCLFQTNQPRVCWTVLCHTVIAAGQLLVQSPQGSCWQWGASWAPANPQDTDNRVAHLIPFLKCST